MRDAATILARLRVPLGFVCGVVVMALATPTPRSLMLGGFVALIGETIRVWAAGHLEKGNEVTCSGPYRYNRHPLYIGSSIIGLGLALAVARLSAALMVAAYLAATITAAVRHEESGMRARFGDQYDAYLESRAQPSDRPFSLSRAIKNKEHETIAGLLAVAAFLAAKAAFSSS